MRKKHSITLLEIMIVIFLIGLIGSVIGYNMKGSLDEGRAFKSREGAKHLQDLFMLAMANGKTYEEIVSDPADALRSTGLVSDPIKMLEGGWKESFVVALDSEDGIKVSSDKLLAYDEKKNSKNKK